MKDQFTSHLVLQLKLPKCEIFDRSDFHYFYTLKSLLEGDFRVKIKKLQIFRGSFGAAKFLTRMLNLILGLFFCLVWAKKNFLVKLLRPFFVVNSDILKFSLFYVRYVLEKLKSLKILNSLRE
jgi:hypothetical protein